MPGLCELKPSSATAGQPHHSTKGLHCHAKRGPCPQAPHSAKSIILYSVHSCPLGITPSTSLNHLNTTRNKWLFWLHRFAGKILTLSQVLISLLGFHLSLSPSSLVLPAPLLLCVCSAVLLALLSCCSICAMLPVKSWSAAYNKTSPLKPLQMAAEWLKKDGNPSRAVTVSPQFPSTCGNDKSRLLQCNRATQLMAKSSRDFFL